MRRLLMISTDRKIFEEGSAVRARMMEYAKDFEEIHIIVFDKVKGQSDPVAILLNRKAKSESQYEAVVSNNCWAYSTRSRSKFLYPFDAIRLGRFIIEKRGITEITTQDPFLTAMSGVSLKKESARKASGGSTISLEIQIHTDIGSPNYLKSISNKIRKSLALKYIPQADTIRVVSERIKRYIVDSGLIDASRIEVRAIHVNIEAIRSAPVLPNADLHKKYPQFKKVLLMASRLEPEKNIGLAIDSWEEIIRHVPEAGLIIVGEGSEILNLKSKILNLGLINSVILEPWADSTTLASYYKTCDAFLNTSLFEGYGMTLVEARAAGCKIISTDVGVAKEVGARIIPWDTGGAAGIIAEELR